MIYDKDPRKQMSLCVDVLKCLEDLLYSMSGTDCAAVLCGLIREGVIDAEIRLGKAD
jgi:hypothetical protein